MPRLVFRIRWSDVETYECVATLDGETFTLTCTCAAGRAGQMCQHRMKLLAGEDPGLIGENSEACLEVRNMLEQSAEALSLYHSVRLTEVHLSKTKRRLNELQYRLARLLGTP